MQLNNILLLTAATATSVTANISPQYVNAVVREVVTIEVPVAAKLIRRDEAACTKAAKPLANNLPPTPDAALLSALQSYEMANPSITMSGCSAPKITGSAGSMFTAYESTFSQWWTSNSALYSKVIKACSDVPAVSEALASAEQQLGTCTSALNKVTGGASGAAATTTASGKGSGAGSVQAGGFVAAAAGVVAMVAVAL